MYGLVFLFFVIVVICVFVWNRKHVQYLKYFVIHLDGNNERRKHIDDMTRVLGQPIQKISAVRGSSISQEEFRRVQKQSTHFYNTNELGCYKSHQKAISMLPYEACEYAVIFEDDFLITQETHDTILKLLDDVPSFDVIMIGNDLRGPPDYIVPSKKSGGSHAILVKCSQAHKIEHFLRTITGPIDDRYYDLIMSYTIDGLVVQPSLVGVNTKLISTLGHY